MTDSNLLLDFPGGVRLNISLPNRAMEDVNAYLGDVITEYAPTDLHRPSNDQVQNVEVSWVPSLGEWGLRDMENGTSAKDGVLFDQKSKTLVSRESSRSLSLNSSTISTEWMMWLLQLKLLETGTTFLHCAGVETGGQAILFPSWGGVGKTAIAKGFVRDEGWRLLGDDFVLLSKDGVVHGFPKSMVLYPYHRSVFPEVFDSGHGPIAPTSANDLLTRLVPLVKPALRKAPGLLAWARSHNPQSVRIPPSKVFGESAIATQARVHTVVWLDRDASIEKPTIRRADGSFLSRLAGSTMSEFDRRCVSLTPMMSGLGIVPFAETYGAWIPILEQALSQSEAMMLQIPAAMPVSDVPEAVKTLLAAEGLFERRG